MANGFKRTVTLAALAAYAVACLGGAAVTRVRSQMRADSPAPYGRPNQPSPGVNYVGDAACAKCHTSEAASYPSTPMAHALESPATSDVLIGNPRLTFRDGPYTYLITRQGGRSIYTVTDGVETISEPILYGFGQGKVSQAFLFQRGGQLYEARVSYYRGIRNLDFTVRHSRSVPTSLEAAIGRPVGLGEAKGCFGCHATAPAWGAGPQPERLTHGVRCEACHGPGEKHLAAVRAKSLKDLKIFNPRDLTPHELTQEFCGTCHFSFEQVMLLPGQDGLNNVRFQPYRIFNSRGHNKNDRRISCVACHDPHGPLEHEASFYDSKCLACHLPDAKAVKTATRAASACPVGTRQCVTCHMPKVELPDMHAKFTDHWIRVVRPGDPVPR
jgi:hypothetical protein